jgi:hypothetical protein
MLSIGITSATTWEVFMAPAPDFVARLRKWRRQRGWSQLELAGRAEISQRHLSFLELAGKSQSRNGDTTGGRVGYLVA